MSNQSRNSATVQIWTAKKPAPRRTGLTARPTHCQYLRAHNEKMSLARAQVLKAGGSAHPNAAVGMLHWQTGGEGSRARLTGAFQLIAACTALLGPRSQISPSRWGRPEVTASIAARWPPEEKPHSCDYSLCWSGRDIMGFRFV